MYDDSPEFNAWFDIAEAGDVYAYDGDSVRLTDSTEAEVFTNATLSVRAKRACTPQNIIEVQMIDTGTWWFEWLHVDGKTCSSPPCFLGFDYNIYLPLLRARRGRSPDG